MFAFATKNRKDALKFLQTIYGEDKITDSKESAGPLLDFVDRDVVRIPDPAMHGLTIEVMRGKNWKRSLENDVVDACNLFHRS